MEIFKDKKFYLFLVINLIFFGMLLRINYSVDTYLLFASPKMGYIKEYLASGRIFTTLFFFILSFLRLSPSVMYTLSFLIGIFCSTLAIYDLNKIVDKYVSNKRLSLLISTFIIINPFVIELWLFIEMGIMMFSILCIVKAFKYFDMYIESNNKHHILYAIIFMLCSLFSYQGTAALFIALSLITILLKSEDMRAILKNSGKSILVYFIPAVINYVFILIFSTKRVGGSLSISTILDNTLKTTQAMIGGFGLFNRSFTIIILVIALVIAGEYVYKSSKRAESLFNVMFTIFMVYVFTIAPNIIQTSERVAIYPRTCYAFYAFVGIIMIITNKKVNNYTMCIYLIGLLILQFLTFSRIEYNRYQVNNADKDIILKIEEKVREYESNSNVKVTKLAIYNKNRCLKFYPKYNDNINVSAIKEEPSGLAAYSYYTKRKLEYTEESKSIYENNFTMMKEKEFNLDQIVIDGDTIHWYLY